MIIVRIFPRGELEESWNRILNNLEAISNSYCTPLYLSQREEENFMSLIYDVKDVDFFSDVLAKRIPSLLQVEKTRTVTLLKPAFFPVPKDRPANLERYQVAVRARPEELESIFNYILHLNYPVDAFPTYAAYSFGEDDILTSMLSTSRDRLNQFLKENLEPLQGVVSADVGLINRSKRVASAMMWKEYRESRLVFRPTAEQEEYDFLEYAEARNVEKKVKISYAEPLLETIANWIDAEKNLAKSYESLATRQEDGTWRTVFLQLAQDSRKNVSTLSELRKSVENLDSERAYRVGLLASPNR
jgi:hypothetical protein